MIEIASKLVVAKPLTQDSGFTWTLSSIAGRALNLAEDKYGKKIDGYTLLGVEFREGVPQLWYPGNCGNVVIQLGIECMNEPERACFQLAHEIIHFLSPTGKQDANVLEEGLATHFQCWFLTTGYSSFWQPAVGEWAPNDDKYIEARSLTEELLKHDSEVIKKLRFNQPVISLIKAEDIKQVCPKVSNKTITKLVSPFY